MKSAEPQSGSGIIRMVFQRWNDGTRLRQAAQRLLWLPGVLAVRNGNGELEIVYRAPAEDVLRQIHHALAAVVEAPRFPDP